MSAQHPTPDDLRTIADNLQAEGHTSRAEVIRNAADALAASKAEATQLRRNIARYLAPFYDFDAVGMQAIAKICDEQIDRTGELLGYVREAAALERK